MWTKGEPLRRAHEPFHVAVAERPTLCVMQSPSLCAMAVRVFFGDHVGDLCVTCSQKTSVWHKSDTTAVP